MAKNYGGLAYSMSFRDWCATQALAGLAATNETRGWPAALYAEKAYAVADAMLAEREKRDGE